MPLQLRTQPARTLATVHASWRVSHGENLPTGDVLRAQDWTRRRFLRVGGLSAAGLVFSACTRVGVSHESGSADVVIVGAGIAGLRCASVLVQGGVAPHVYEAASSVGGRTRTLRGFFENGQETESGGEFISSEHAAMRSLAASLDLDLERVDGGSHPGTDDVYWIDRTIYPPADLNDDWGRAYPRVQAALRAAPWPQTFDSNTQAGRVLDDVPVPEWIDAEIEDGMAGRLGKVMYTAVTTEYGGEAADLPALALIYLLGWNPRREIEIAGTDEAFHVVGGSDLITSRMAERLPMDSITVGTALEAVRDLGDGRYRCTFRSNASVFDVASDHVVLALPFTKLREVDLAGTEISETKRRAIQELGMGLSSKLHLQFSSKPWLDMNRSGFALTEGDSFQMVWDETYTSTASSGILVNYTGGNRSVERMTDLSGAAPPDLVTEMLEAIEPLFPGSTTAFNGKAWRDHWIASPWHYGSYSYLGRGQHTGFSGVEAVPEGNLHFCGEHTSIEFRGFMEGAARSGTRAAREILG